MLFYEVNLFLHSDFIIFVLQLLIINNSHEVGISNKRFLLFLSQYMPRTLSGNQLEKQSSTIKVEIYTLFHPELDTIYTQYIKLAKIVLSTTRL